MTLKPVLLLFTLLCAEEPVDGRRHLLVEAMDPRATANIQGHRFEYRNDEIDALGQVARVLETETGRVIDEVFQGSDPRAYEARSSDGNHVYQSYLPEGGLEEMVDPLGNTTQLSMPTTRPGERSVKRTQRTTPLTSATILWGGGCSRWMLWAL